MVFIFNESLITKFTAGRKYNWFSKEKIFIKKYSNKIALKGQMEEVYKCNKEKSLLERKV